MKKISIHPSRSIMLPWIILLINLLLCWSVPAVAQQRDHPGRISFVPYGFGLCTTDISGTYPDAASPSGRSVSSGNFRLVQKTRRIKARIGGHFGMNYQFLGPSGKVFQVTKVWRYPGPIRNATSGRSFNELRDEIEVSANTMRYAAYLLEVPEELKKGKWSLEFYYRGKLVHKEDFELY